MASNEVDASSSLSSYGDFGKAVCYLCLDGGDDETNQPLRRDCACRGTDAGFVHLSCLTNYAETKSKQTTEMNDFIMPWNSCPNCHQDYRNDLAVDIASKFVSFVRQQYPQDTQRQVESLYLKLCAFTSMLNRLQPVRKREAGITANVLLSLIERMKRELSPLSDRYSQVEAYAYNTHGRIAADEGTEESARRAVVHFERVLVVCKAIGDDQGIASAKSNIALAKSKYKGGSNEEELKASQELYEILVAKYGEEHEYTILAGKNYAIDLHKANRGDEARDLLTKLLAMSKQVLGPEHNITKDIASALKWINFTLFISTILFVFILIGVLAMLYPLAKKMIFHSGKFYNEIIAKFSIQCEKEKKWDEL
jgi:hypothetical protein